MKNLILTITALVIISLINLLNAQAPNWVWAKSAGGINNEQAKSVTVDSFGNIIVVGWFNSSNLTFGSTLLPNSGGSDMFIVKYDSLGNVLWAKSANGNDNDEGLSVTADGNGNLIVSGYFKSATISFDSYTLVNNGLYDLFILKYDYAGNILWAKSAGGNNYDVANDVTIDVNGNIIATGWFSSPTITFDSVTLIGINTQAFIVKYDTNGTLLWAKSSGGNGGCESNSINSDLLGNIIITGHFYSPNLIFDTLILNSNGARDMFVAKFDDFGELLWATSAGGTIDDRATSVSVDALGNIIVTGWFESSNITFGTTVLVGTGWKQKLFLVKIDTYGNVLWAKSSNGNLHSARGNTISADLSGNIFVSGLFSGTITLGTWTLINNGSIGFSDAYIVKYDNLGNVIWAKSTGGFGHWDEATSVSVDGSGMLMVTGFFNSSSIDFGSTVLYNTGNFDLFIAKLDTVMTTGIEITENKNGFSLYPNPASDILTITNWQFAMGKDVTITITDLTGKLIYTTTATTSKTEVNTKDFSKGVYLIKLQSKDFVETRKVIKN